MIEWIQANGGIAGMGVRAAVVVLVMFSIVSIAVMIERLIVLRKVRSIEDRDYRALREALRAGKRDTLQTIAVAGASPIAIAVQAGLESSDLGEAKMNDAIDQEVSMQGAELSRNLPVLATVASVAPYVGLFGTVLGILSAFGKIAETGQTGAKVVAGPISEALTTTALGLAVAIPAVMAYNYFSGRVNALSLQIEDHSLEIGARLPTVVLEPAKTEVPSEIANTGGGGRRRKHRKHHAMPMAEINIIPLVDITLVLLIIFMATTAFVKDAGLNMKLPAASTNDDVVAQENKDLSIALAKNGAIFMDGKVSTEAAVKSAMLQAAKLHHDTRVIIKGDENIEYKRVIRVMDMARNAGLPKVSLGTRLLEGNS